MDILEFLLCMVWNPDLVSNLKYFRNWEGFGQYYRCRSSSVHGALQRQRNKSWLQERYQFQLWFQIGRMAATFLNWEVHLKNKTDLKLPDNRWNSQKTKILWRRSHLDYAAFLYAKTAVDFGNPRARMNAISQCWTVTWSTDWIVTVHVTRTIINSLLLTLLRWQHTNGRTEFLDVRGKWCHLFAVSSVHENWKNKTSVKEFVHMRSYAKWKINHEYQQQDQNHLCRYLFPIIELL